MIESSSAVSGGRSPRQSNSALHTTERGMNGAESAGASPRSAEFDTMLPEIARAYGSSNSLAGLHRSPAAGSHGPCTRNP